jgi:N-acetylmuramoyl-L-alanine amidase
MLIGKTLNPHGPLGRACAAGGLASRGRRLLAVAGLLVALSTAFASAAAPAQPRSAPATSPAAQATPGAIAAVDAQLDSQERSATFRVLLSAPLDFSVEALADPMRLVVDLPEVSFQAIRINRRAGMLVSQVRAGLVAPGRSRLVFELGQPAELRAHRQERRADGVIALTLDFAAIAPAAFAAKAAQGAERRAREALRPLERPAARSDARPLVVIDPGHGGIDPGAVAKGGITEKAVVLAIGLKLRELIEQEGLARVVMTRADDRFLTLSERVRVAREAQADLFISLHADSLSAAQEVRGATVYTGSERATDAESARLAQRENATDALAGADTVLEVEEVGDILADLARRETRILSAAAAARLVTEMSGTVRMHRVPQRAAGFRVLTAPDVPSLLIELGFLSSRSDIELLISPEWQTRAAGAIARAVRGHFASGMAKPRERASISP